MRLFPSFDVYVVGGAHSSYSTLPIDVRFSTIPPQLRAKLRYRSLVLGFALASLLCHLSCR
jgi:hypothetical protein